MTMSQDFTASFNIRLEQVLSPCVRNCCLDDNDICLGCFRHLEEIKQWTLITDDEKRAVLILANQRRLERGR